MKTALRLTGALLLALGASTVSVSAHAQQHTLKTKIPFEFTVGDTRMPAGEYRIKEDRSFLVFETAGHTAAVQSYDSHADSLSGSKLVFHQYGDQYFLHEVFVPNVASLNRLIAPSKAERGASQREVPTIVAVR